MNENKNIIICYEVIIKCNHSFGSNVKCQDVDLFTGLYGVSFPIKTMGQCFLKSKSSEGSPNDPRPHRNIFSCIRSKAEEDRDEISVASIDSLDKIEKNANDDEIDELDAYIDPPMPNIGVPVDVSRLEERQKRGIDVLEALVIRVDRYSAASILSAKVIPVSEDSERVTVTKEVTDRIALKRSIKQNLESREQNMVEIQQALLLRKDAILLMNSNYSGVKVAAVDPINLAESRTTVVHHDGDDDDD